MAKFHLSATDIKAFSGTIDRIPKKIRKSIDEGELLTSLSDNSQMFAYFNVSEPEYLNYQTDIKIVQILKLIYYWLTDSIKYKM
jgi:membrane fusion protein (multidrug efflux system)